MAILAISAAIAFALVNASESDASTPVTDSGKENASDDLKILVIAH